MAAMHDAAGGRGEVPDADHPGVVVRDSLCHCAYTARKLRRAPGDADQPLVHHLIGLPDPTWLLHLLPDARPNILNPTLRPPPCLVHLLPHQPQQRYNPTPAHRHRPCPLRRHHARLNRRNVPRSSSSSVSDDDAMVLVGALTADGVVGGIQHHRTGRVLLQPVPEEHAQRHWHALLPASTIASYTSGLMVTMVCQATCVSRQD